VRRAFTALPVAASDPEEAKGEADDGGRPEPRKTGEQWERRRPEQPTARPGGCGVQRAATCGLRRAFF